ncbi:MAG: histidine phosphatase family protein [Rhodocyclaceae bacterium]|nr:histidine phosphatase family protein [Rhodocyclaceae bacterium]
MRAARFCFIRHGETDWNAGRRIQGQIDIPLSAQGHAQARATAAALVQEEFAAIYSSDLARARQTAEALAHLKHLPVRLEPRLRERCYGVFQGLTHAECAQRHASAYARHLAREADFAPAGGESLSAFADRVTTTCLALARRHAGEAIAIFTHGGVLDIVHRRATGRPLTTPRDFLIPNCGINWIAIEDDHWTLLSWAERDHLEGGYDESHDKG